MTALYHNDSMLSIACPHLAMVLNQPGAARHWDEALQHGWHPETRASLNRARQNAPDLRSVFWPPVRSGEETAL